MCEQDTAGVFVGRGLWKGETGELQIAQLERYGRPNVAEKELRMDGSSCVCVCVCVCVCNVQHIQQSFGD